MFFSLTRHVISRFVQTLAFQRRASSLQQADVMTQPHPSRRPFLQQPPPSTPSPFRFIVRKAGDGLSYPGSAPAKNPFHQARPLPHTPHTRLEPPQPAIVRKTGRFLWKECDPILDDSPASPSRSQYPQHVKRRRISPQSERTVPHPREERAKGDPHEDEDILGFEGDEGYIPPSTLASSPCSSSSSSSKPLVRPMRAFHVRTSNLLVPTTSQKATPKFKNPTPLRIAGDHSTVTYSDPNAFPSKYRVHKLGDELPTGGRIVQCYQEGTSPDELACFILLKGQTDRIEVGGLLGIKEGIRVRGVVGGWQGEWRLSGKWGFLREERGGNG